MQDAVNRYFPPSGLQRQDLEQEGLIGLLRAVENYQTDKGASFETFARLCIERNVVRAIIAATRQKHRPLDGYVGLDVPLSDDNRTTLGDMLPSSYRATPHEIVIFKEWLESFHDVFCKLSSLEQEAYELVCLQGHSHEHASRVIGVEPKVIDNATQRAKGKLNKRVSSPFEE